MAANAVSHPVFDRLTCLGEPTRARLMHVLERQELMVSELCSILQAPQSTVSRHLKALSDAGWVTSRPEGTRRFYRVDRSRSRRMGGTGLGLSLVRWTAEAHGGRVELDTELGRGSTFRLVLPASREGV